MALFWRDSASLKVLREVEEGAQQEAVEFLSKHFKKKKGPNHMEAYWLLQVSPKKDKMK